MFKVKVGEIYASREALRELSEQKIDAKTSFHLARVLKKCQEELEAFEKVRNQKVIEHGEKDENGNMTVKPDNFLKFNEELLPVLDAEVEITVEKISIEELGKLEIEPKKLLTLEWLIQA